MKRFLGILVVVAFGIAGQLHASWQTKDTVGLPVIVYQGNQWNVHGIPDGQNGTIVIWQDRRDGVADKVMAQRIDAMGNLTWNEFGNQLSYTKGFQYYPQIIPDGNGGAFVAWEDNRNGVDYDIYAQHISLDGNLIWGVEGTAVCVSAGHQYNPMLVADGSGGLIISWQDKRSGGWDVYAQHLNGNGSITWDAAGVAICAADGDQLNPQIAMDGFGGAVLTWTDYRASATLPDVYAQRVSADGAVLWSKNGIAACLEGNTQWRVQIAGDNNGGALLSWLDRRSGATDQLFGQHLDANGGLMWGETGVRLCTAPGIQYNQKMIGDGAGGALLVWQDNRTGSEYDIYAQRVNTDGALLWGRTGKAICTALGQQYVPDITFDGATVLFVWQDKRNTLISQTFAQSCDLSGLTHWNLDGVQVAHTLSEQSAPVAIPDGVTGLICAWTDLASGSGDIYGQRVGGNGVVGGGSYRSLTQDQYALKALKIWQRGKGVLASPNGGNLRDTLFGRDTFADGIMIGIAHPERPKDFAWEVFNQSRALMNALPQTTPGRPFDLIKGRKMFGMYRNPSKTRYNNRLAGEAIALKLNIAASDAGILPTGFGDLIYFDPAGSATPLNHRSLRVISRYLDTVLTNWASQKGVDYQLLDATLQRINGSCSSTLDTLSSSPLRFNAARSIFAVPFLAPGPAAPQASSEFALGSLPGVKSADAQPLTFSLLQNYPNPFNPGTQIEFNLVQSSVVTLSVYNVLGQKVVTLLDNARMDEGYQNVWFDGTTMASGTYFYRLSVVDASTGASSASVFRKMNLIK